MNDTVFSSLSERVDLRVPDAGIQPLFATKARWQAWLSVEAALALAEADLGMIPRESAEVITAVCQVEHLDIARVQQEMARTNHPLMPLIIELSRTVGEPHSGWVHWGATTQNITQTGDVLIVRKAHRIILGQLGSIMQALADLAERSAEMVMAGRTLSQHAVPITFGLKGAGWIDEVGRHITRLRELEPRLFVALVGGAAGTFASFGDLGPEVQRGVAKRLGLGFMPVPSRNILDHFAEFVCVLGLLAATCGKISREIYNMMRTEYGEVEEPIPANAVGSSTMPQKRNPVLCMDVLGLTAEVRALVPLAIEAIQSDHEGDQASNVMYEAMRRASILTGEVLGRLQVILGGLHLHPERMRANLELSGGMISAEAIMLELGKTIGRQHAHEVIHEAVQAAAAQNTPFSDHLAADPRITAHLSRSEIEALLDPARHTGLSARMAHEQAAVARRIAHEVRVHLDSSDITATIGVS